MLSREQRLRGGLWGLLVGDALGVPYEFHEPQEIPPREQIEFQPPPDFNRAHRSTPPGTWSDDGAHALCLLASLLKCGELDIDDLMARLLRWYQFGYMAVDNRVFDVGIQTSRALFAYRDGLLALRCGPAQELDNGNGALMRVLPLAMWHRGSDAELIAHARLQSRITHGHARSQLCCALYCLWARRILAGQEIEPAYVDALAALRATIPEGSSDQAELEFHIRPDDPPQGEGGGYVVDALRSAHMVLLSESSYENVVRAAVALGYDTDTTACIAGGLAGLYWGEAAIPQRWRDALRGREMFEPMLDTLIKM